MADRTFSQLTPELLAGALQKAWDEFCADTHCVPDCIHIHGPSTTRVSANFREGNFAAHVVNWLCYQASSEEGEGFDVG